MLTVRPILRSKSCSAWVRGVLVNEAGATPHQAPQDGTSSADTVHLGSMVRVTCSRARGSGAWSAAAGAGGRPRRGVATGRGATDPDPGRDTRPARTPQATAQTTR